MADGECAIGIDLGTTYSCVAVWENDRVEIIANDQGNRTTPSFVAFADGNRLLGDAAKNQCAMNPTNTIYDAKRLIGRRYNDPSTLKDIESFAFKVVDDKDRPKICAEVDGTEKQFDPEEVSAMVLSCMKSTAEAYLGKPVTKAVITVPAYFNDGQRAATKSAGKIAGLEVLRIINEPTAASIAYGLDSSREQRDMNILIFDLGGGTFDVSVLNISGGVFTVRATAGDTHLGGEDFDAKLVDYFRAQLMEKNGVDLSDNKRALRRLKTACERAKRTLSTMARTSVEIDSLYDGNDFKANISRAKFEELCADLFNRCLEPVSKALEDSKLKKSQIDEVVLVGGSTRVPKVQAMLAKFFNGKQLNKSINPDEAVAYGAAVQAALLTGMKSKTAGDVLLMDVVPLSLGVEMQGDIMAVVVPRNTTIPCMKKQTFVTSENDMHDPTTVKFTIYEGERVSCKDNNRLGTFHIEGLPPMKVGEAKLETTFEIDANGLLKVSAKELKTGKNAKIAIQNDAGRLTADAVDKMVYDAKKFEEADSVKRKTAQAREQLVNYHLEMSENIESPELAKKLPKADMEALQKASAEILEWLGANSTATESDYRGKRLKYEKTVTQLLGKLGGQEAARKGFRQKRKQAPRK